MTTRALRAGWGQTLIFPIAHFGHWYVTLLYLGPVVILVIALSIQTWRDKRRDRRDDSSD
jgi:hypothetical protein